MVTEHPIPENSKSGRVRTAVIPTYPAKVLERVFKLGDQLVAEGKITEEELKRRLEPLGYEGPDV